jgi:hypothetical protein
LEEDFLETESDGVKFDQVPIGVDDRTSDVATDSAALEAFDGEDETAAAGFLELDFGDAGNLFKALLDGVAANGTGAGSDFDVDELGSTEAAVEILHGVGSDQLTFRDNDDAFAGAFDLREDVGTEDDGVLPSKLFDEAKGFLALFGIEAGGRLIEDEHIGIMDDRASETDALAIAFR